MSYNVALPCGCVIYVSCHPQTGVAHTRVLEYRHTRCGVRNHEVGLHLEPSELLTDSSGRPVVTTVDSRPRKVLA